MQREVGLVWKKYFVANKIKMEVLNHLNQQKALSLIIKPMYTYMRSHQMKKRNLKKILKWIDLFNLMIKVDNNAV